MKDKNQGQDLNISEGSDKSEGLDKSEDLNHSTVEVINGNTEDVKGKLDKKESYNKACYDIKNIGGGGYFEIINKPKLNNENNRIIIGFYNDLEFNLDYFTELIFILLKYGFKINNEVKSLIINCNFENYEFITENKISNRVVYLIWADSFVESENEDEKINNRLKTNIRRNKIHDSEIIEIGKTKSNEMVDVFYELELIIGKLTSRIKNPGKIINTRLIILSLNYLNDRNEKELIIGFVDFILNNKSKFKLSEELTIELKKLADNIDKRGNLLLLKDKLRELNLLIINNNSILFPLLSLVNKIDGSDGKYIQIKENSLAVDEKIGAGSTKSKGGSIEEGEVIGEIYPSIMGKNGYDLNGEIIYGYNGVEYKDKGNKLFGNKDLTIEDDTETGIKIVKAGKSGYLDYITYLIYGHVNYKELNSLANGIGLYEGKKVTAEGAKRFTGIIKSDIVNIFGTVEESIIFIDSSNEQHKEAMISKIVNKSIVIIKGHKKLKLGHVHSGSIIIAPGSDISIQILGDNCVVIGRDIKIGNTQIASLVLGRNITIKNVKSKIRKLLLGLIPYGNNEGSEIGKIIVDKISNGEVFIFSDLLKSYIDINDLEREAKELNNEDSELRALKIKKEYKEKISKYIDIKGIYEYTDIEARKIMEFFTELILELSKLTAEDITDKKMKEIGNTIVDFINSHIKGR